MRISSLEEYGLRCMLALARQGTAGQLSISDIAELEGLSAPYASKLLAILRKAKLVTAVRGRTGGFCISREPGTITLLEVMTALGGPLIDPDHCARFRGQRETCVHGDNCSVHHVLDTLASYIGDVLGRTTLEDLVNHRETRRTAAPTIVSPEDLISSGSNTTDISGPRHNQAGPDEDETENYKQQSI